MYYLRLMFRGLSGCLLLALLAVSAAFAGDDQNLLPYPVQDARDTFRSGQYEFV